MGRVCGRKEQRQQTCPRTVSAGLSGNGSFAPGNGSFVTVAGSALDRWSTFPQSSAAGGHEADPFQEWKAAGRSAAVLGAEGTQGLTSRASGQGTDFALSELSKKWYQFTATQ